MMTGAPNTGDRCSWFGCLALGSGVDGLGVIVDDKKAWQEGTSLDGWGSFLETRFPARGARQ